MMNWPGALQHLNKQLASARWRWVLPASVIAIIGAFALWAMTVVIYAISLGIRTHGVPDRGQIIQFGDHGRIVVPVLIGALTLVVAALVTRRVGTSVVNHGLLTGIVVGAGSLVLWTLIRHSPGLWGWLGGILAVGAGWLGGLEGRSVVNDREALYRSARAVASARSPQAIVDAIGAHLADSRVDRVALWQVASSALGMPDEVTLVASWAPDAAMRWPTGSRLRASAFPGLRHDVPTVLTIDRLPATARERWSNLGARAVVLVPLIAADGAWSGLITVASSARALTWGATGGYQAIGAQAVLALENLRLIEQGRQIGVLAERQRLSREIHDAVKQQVFAAEMQIAAALALVERDSAATKARLVQAEAMMRSVQEELTAVIRELRPATLEDKGLGAVLRDYATEWSARSNIPATIRIQGDQATPLEVEKTLFRIAQEALANVTRHSQASAVTIELRWGEDRVILQIADDGQGFAPENGAGDGYGLASMRERMAALGGELAVESAPGAGTRITCRCPLAETAGEMERLWNGQ